MEEASLVIEMGNFNCQHSQQFCVCVSIQYGHSCSLIAHRGLANRKCLIGGWEVGTEKVSVQHQDSEDFSMGRDFLRTTQCWLGKERQKKAKNRRGILG